MNSPTDGQAAVPALADFIALNDEIAALAAARIPLESHLAATGRSLRGKAGDLAARIGRRLSAGESLSAAMDAECGSLPASYRAVVEAGIESGQLGSAIESVVTSASRLQQLRRVSGAAVLYPLMILIVASTMFAIVVTQVTPQFGWLGHYQFAPIRALAEWPYTGVVLTLVVPALLIAIVYVWWRSSSRLGWTGLSRWGLLGWVPGSGRIRRWSEAAKFADLLHLLVERGVPFDRALRLSGEAAEDRKIRGAALRLAERAGWGGAARLAGGGEDEVISADFPFLIRLALRHSGDRELLAGGLRQAAIIYHDRAVRAAEWFAEYAPILLTVVVGGSITFAFALFVLWPYAATLNELAGVRWR
jgi:general secretion pathway protein F